MLQAIIPTPQITLGSTKLPFGQTTTALSGLTQVTLNPLGNTNDIVVSGGSDSGSANNPLGLIVTGTLNTTGVVDGVVLFADITNTATGVGTLLADLQVGGSSKFNIDMVGDVVAAGTLTATKINGLTIPTTTGTLSIANGKTLTASNTLTLAGTDASTLNIGAGGTLGSNAFTSTAYAPLASPTFSGIVTLPDGGTLTSSLNTFATNIALSTGGNGTLAWGASGSNYLAFRNNAATIMALDYTHGAILATGSYLGFTTSNSATPTPTATLSEASSGVLQVGTTTANALGGMQMATLALGGASIGSNALAVTGTTLLSGQVNFTADSTYNIGQNGSPFNRPNNIYVGTAIQIGGNNNLTASGLVIGGAASLSGTSNGFVLSTNVANTTPLTISGGSITGSSTTSPGISITGTLNTTGNVDGAAILANITNTASGASTTLMDLQIGGSSRFTIDTSGNVLFGNASGTNSISPNGNSQLWLGGNNGNNTISVAASGVSLLSTVAFGWSSSSTSPSFGSSTDTRLLRDAAGILAQRNSTSAQTVRVYNTYTSSTSYEAAEIDWQGTSNVLSIGTIAGSGGGSIRNMQFVIGGTNKLDYGVTNSGVWSSAAQFVAPTFLSNASVSNSVAAYQLSNTGGNSGIGVGTNDDMVFIFQGITHANLTASSFILDGSALGFASSYGATEDSRLSRLAAGSLSIDTTTTGNSAGSLKLANVLHNGVAFAGLPGSPTAGTVACVTDSTTTTWGATISGSGTHTVLAWWNGSAWTVVGS